MRLSSHRWHRAKPPGLQLTSMIDVVFLLLIFFLVTTSVVHEEQQLAAAIRHRLRAAGESGSDLEPARIEITRLGNTVVYRLGAFQTSRFEELSPRLQAFGHKELGAFVRAADDVPFSAPAQVLAECRRAGFVTLTLIPPDDIP